MEQSLWFEETAERMKEKLFSSSAHLYAFLPISTYETAWVAMVPDPNDPTNPMFPNYLVWVIHNQNALGFWFDQEHSIDIDHHDEHINYKHQWSNDDLLATLACLIALKTWDSTSFSRQINKGLKFLQGIMGKELLNMRNNKDGGGKAGHALLRRWFLMVKLAKAKGLKVFPTQQMSNEIFYEFALHGTKLSKEEADEIITEERVVMREIAFKNHNLALLDLSPSVTACAYMITRDQTYKTCLENMLVDCQHGVPPIYLEDRDFIKLCVVDHLERLGCAEHFSEEIRNIMDHLHIKWIAEESTVSEKDDAFKIYKDSLSFRLLRMRGYPVSPRRFCRFIDDEKMLSHLKDNHAFFLGPMLSIYKASHIAFPEDYELDKAGAFSRQILQMGILSLKSENESSIFARSTEFEQEIEHELGLKWLARMDHLENRLYIERGGIYHIWTGLNAPCSILRNDDLLQLAIDNFAMRQSVYRKELNELHRWSKNTGLFTMGFGREKTAYCYFAIASATCLPLDTESRKEATKCATFFTVADDFFDEKGSLHDLFTLTDALQRWEGKGLTSHSKIIFSILHNLVHDISVKTFKQHGHDVKKILQDAWKDIFMSWLKEVEWTKNSHYPSIDQYIENAKTSVAVQMILLPKCYLTKSKIIHQESFWDFRSAAITKSLEVLCRLLNDLESYEREAKAGEPNIVLLHLMQNPKVKIDDVVAFIRKTLKMKEKEFLQLVMTKDSESDMPAEWKMMHLSCLKIFQMFYNSENAFDSPTALLDSINKAIYEPLLVKKTINQPAADFNIKDESDKIKTVAPYTRMKLSRSSNKRTLLSIDSNKWRNPRAKKKLHKLSFACSFMAYNTAINKSLL